MLFASHPSGLSQVEKMKLKQKIENVHLSSFSNDPKGVTYKNEVPTTTLSTRTIFRKI